jgi:hypothetical protein
MSARPLLIAFCSLLAIVTLAAKKPAVVRPARPADEVAEAFYPEIKKVMELHQRWAAGARGAELDSCRRHYRSAILDAFGQYSIQRRREFMQTRWPRTYVVLCKAKRGTVKTCEKALSAPLGQEFDTVGMRFTGRGLLRRPAPSPDRRRLLVAVAKKGEGTSRTRVFVSTRRTVEDIERELDSEISEIRKKLERHSLPSDKTLSKYQP